jgi:asparaginyl-tRNA synthetase
MNRKINPRVTLVESLAIQFARDYLRSEGFMEMFPSNIVRASGACENINTLFEVGSNGRLDWFLDENGNGRQVYLAQTKQLYLEAYVPYFEKTYCMGSSFRAEAAVDDRHLTEFGLLEIEFEGGFEQLLQYIEGTLRAMVFGFSKLNRKMLEATKMPKRICELLFQQGECYPRITYDEAIECLIKLGCDIKWGDDISSDFEKVLVREVGNRPLFITHYPDPQWPRKKENEVEKFFNMLPDKKGNVLSADLILPFGGEAVGAAARVHKPDELVSRLTKSKMFKNLVEQSGSIDDFSWYIENIQEKSVAHAGCGFGIARIMQWILGEEKIGDAVSFAPNRASVI